MDIFTRYNRRNIIDRQIDTLIGLSKGLIADGKINQLEAEFLQNWLLQNSGSDSPVILNLLDKVVGFLEDGILDDDESKELFAILSALTGDCSEAGEVSKTSTLPVCSPAPNIEFSGKNFLFTGTCAFGTRKQCQKAIESLGGSNSNCVTKTLNHLILGTYVTDSWAHESFGRKIEKAIEYRDKGLPLRIVTEEHWLQESGL